MLRIGPLRRGVANLGHLLSQIRTSLGMLRLRRFAVITRFKSRIVEFESGNRLW
jgi:hypothetical protein